MSQPHSSLLSDPNDCGTFKGLELGISHRTYQRWSEGDGVEADQRPEVARPEPANKLTRQEREEILATCNRSEYASLPPSQIVPDLADKGLYLASEASFYRVLNEAGQLHHRGKAQAPRKVSKPKAFKASAPNQVWSWDSVPQRHQRKEARTRRVC